MKIQILAAVLFFVSAAQAAEATKPLCSTEQENAAMVLADEEAGSQGLEGNRAVQAVGRFFNKLVRRSSIERQGPFVVVRVELLSQRGYQGPACSQYDLAVGETHYPDGTTQKRLLWRVPGKRKWHWWLPASARRR